MFSSCPRTAVRGSIVLSHLCHKKVIILQQEASLFAQKSLGRQ